MATFLMAARMLLSSSLFLLTGMYVPTLFSMSLRAHLSLETWSSSTTCHSDHVLHILGVLGEAPMAATVPLLVHVLSHLMTLVEAHRHGGKGVPNRGCHSSVAAAAENPLSYVLCYLLLVEFFKRLLNPSLLYQAPCWRGW